MKVARERSLKPKIFEFGPGKNANGRDLHSGIHRHFITEDIVEIRMGKGEFTVHDFKGEETLPLSASSCYVPISKVYLETKIGVAQAEVNRLTEMLKEYD